MAALRIADSRVKSPLRAGWGLPTLLAHVSKSVFFQCQRSTACCRRPGFVRLAEGEAARIAAHLGLDEDTFIQRYTRLTPQRNGLALIDKPTGECFFLEGCDCVLQAVKPVQCVGFPNTWNFPGWREMCKAVPIEISNETPNS